MEPFHVDDEMATLLGGMEDEDLHSFAELQEDPASDEQISSLNEGAVRLAENYRHSGRLEDLNEAIRMMDQAMEIAGRYIQPYMMSNVGAFLGRRYERTGSIDDLNRAVDVAGQAVNATPEDHPDRAAILNNLGNWLGTRFDRTGSIDDLNRAVDVVDEAVNATPEDHPDRAGRLNNLGSWLGTRFDRTGSIDDLNRAVDVVDQAVNATPTDHPDRAAILNNLGSWLGRRFERTGSIDDLNRAVDVADQAVNATPTDHPDRAGRLNNLGSWLGTRFERTGSIDDLNRAVGVAGQAVNATPEDHPGRAGRLNNLGSWLGTRFDRTGSIDDLNHAVDVVDEAVNATPEDHPDRAAILNNLGNWLGRRFERTGSIDDLNRAVDVAGQAVNATPTDHPGRAGYLNNFGNRLGRRFERTGSIDDLNRAVDVVDQAVNATPEDHPDRAGRLNNLGSWLGRRFDRTGSIDDLNRAVDVADQAVNATPEDHPDRAGYLNNLGNRLGTRFERTGSIDDLNRAVDVAGQAVNATPTDHPGRAGYLNNFGNRLGRRFERTGSIDDLNRAVDVVDQAVNATPEDHPDRAGRLNNLGSWLGRRFDRTGSIDDLNRAVDVADQAVNATPEDHPDRAGYLNNLGNKLGRRSDRTESIDDLNRRLSSYEEGWRCYTAPPSIRIRLARNAAQIRAERLDWEGSSHLLQQAVEILPGISPRWIKHTDKQHMLADFAGLSSAAAATALNAGKNAHDALQFLELGRGIIASLLIETRGDISDLQQQHPGLADEFILLQDELDSPEDSLSSLSPTGEPYSWESLSKRRRNAVHELDKLRLRIRAQPGFENFHLPPTIDELKAAAHPDPIIVVNLSPYRCDAFIIECHQVRVLELPNLTLERVHQHAEELQISRQLATLPISLLEWLWDVVARPVLDALGFQEPVSDTNWPHVWWIPTGLLSQLPLHAAGYHTKGGSETVLDRVMSSYASTVKALIHGRQLHFREPVGPVSDYALLVAMYETPNLPANGSLPFTINEIKIVKDLCPSLQLRPITPSLRKDDILRELQACRIFHFAGHGSSDPAEPSRSRLLLEDWETNPLTVGDLRDHRLHENPPFLGFLSACSTGANKVAKLADEGINLINAFQLAGFRHVVGTLWEVSDMHCVDVARVLYETLRDEGMTDMAVCRGLHRAIRALRDGGIEVEGTRDGTLISGTTEGRGATNAYWIPYVHFGV
ncbi:CHAT domain-containing protein [Xylariaceae sp. FL1651]|nr:CHAT domain-containing protein [Xylariaceae sp. FL1651]